MNVEEITNLNKNKKLIRKLAKKYDALNAIIDRCTFDKEKSILSITYRISV